VIPLPHRLPAALRAVAYGVAVAVLLYLCLAPSQDLPQEHLWDKAEHAIAWFVLAAIGLAFWPWRPARIAGFALALGAAVEVLQATMPFGRDGDWRDWVADSVGVAVALVCWAMIRGLAKLAPSRA
jgi:VanZ family protein